MYDRMIKRVAGFIYTYGDAGEENREVYEYGIELILMYLINATALLLLGLVLGRLKESFLLLIGFALQQSFAGGYHAKTHLRCFLLMLVGWTVSILLLPVVQSYRYMPGGLAIIGVLAVFVFAPVKHVNFPMSREKAERMRKIARLIAVLMSVVVILVSMLPVGNRIIASVVGMTLFLSAVSILAAVIKEKTAQRT